tara:strand:- start:4415 stop:4930 length:516 start_codon:yes stop_codon:yes gene_type:complete
VEPQQIDQLDLYVMLKTWVRPRLSWFPRWSFDDILHEAYLIAIEKMADFDPTKGNAWTYLNPRLFDPVWRKYMHLEGFRIDRKQVGGRWITRKPVRVVTTIGKPPDIEDDQDRTGPSPITRWWTPSPECEDLMALLMRGLSPAQAARSRNVTPSSVSFMIQRIRSRWPQKP